MYTLLLTKLLIHIWKMLHLMCIFANKCFQRKACTEGSLPPISVCRHSLECILQVPSIISRTGVRSLFFSGSNGRFHGAIRPLSGFLVINSMWLYSREQGLRDGLEKNCLCLKMYFVPWWLWSYSVINWASSNKVKQVSIHFVPIFSLTIKYFKMQHGVESALVATWQKFSKCSISYDSEFSVWWDCLSRNQFPELKFASYGKVIRD